LSRQELHWLVLKDLELTHHQAMHQKLDSCSQKLQHQSCQESRSSFLLWLDTVGTSDSVVKTPWCDGALQLQSTHHLVGLVEAAQVVVDRLLLEGQVF
jgi:hypothetical protein